MQHLIRLLLILLSTQACFAEATLKILSKRTSADNIHEYEIKSSLQSSPTQIRVLLPLNLKAGLTYPVVYVLPVEAKRESRFGDGMKEILDNGLHQEHEAIFVAPTFSELPWYADHPTKLNLQQESYFTQVVVPFVEGRYPAAPSKDSRLLLGFSKSGWGAWTLLLRHSAMFGRACAWDAPLMMTTVGRYGNGPIFGTQQNFDGYRLDQLLQKVQPSEGSPRLILTGYGNFRQHHQEMHELLNRLDIPHIERDGPHRTHDWHSGWVPEAVQLLLEK